MVYLTGHLSLPLIRELSLVLREVGVEGAVGGLKRKDSVEFDGDIVSQGEMENHNRSICFKNHRRD